MKGVVFSDKTYKLTYEQLLASRIGVESFKDADEFFKTFPALKLILDSFNASDLERFNMTVVNPIGSLISENYLRACGFLS